MQCESRDLYSPVFNSQSFFIMPAVVSEVKFACCKKVQAIPLLMKASFTNSTNKLEKIVHFVRHAQGFHNVAGEEDYEAYKSEEFEDALLTVKGEKQCSDLNASAIHGKNADLVIVSPMRRCLATASLSFPNHVGKIPWIAHESIREQSGLHPCDRRKPVSQHKVNFPHINYDLVEHDIDPLYYKYDGREDADNVTKRAFEFFEFLSTREEKEIIVVTHSAYLRHMFEQNIEMKDKGEEKERYGYFHNCEMKSYIITLNEKSL
jgi:broad specificity phosphatase PhoE